MDEQTDQNPWARPPAESPTRPLWLDAPPPSPPTAQAPTPPPPPPPNPWDKPPPAHAEAEKPAAVGWLKPAIAGAVVGALVAAGVAGGIVAATDDTGSTTSPSVTRASSQLAGEQLDVGAVLDAVEHGVVTIQVQGVDPESRQSFESAGTGMVIDEDGLVLTNAHVVENAVRTDVVLYDGKTVAADLVGRSADNDIALVRIRNASDLDPVTFGSPSALQVGDDVVAVGNALNLGETPTVTSGIVSALNRTISEPERGIELNNLIQTDAAINRGNSGGPLVNARGEVVGINTAVAAEGQNIGFAIALDSAVRDLIADIGNGQGDIVSGAFLGVRTIDVGNVVPAAREQLGIERDDGAVVSSVIPGSGADEAGLEPGDVITSVDGRTTKSAADVGNIVRDHDPGDEVEIRYERNGEERTTRATLGSTEVERAGG